MSPSDVVRLDDYRGQRQARLRRTLALYQADPDRGTLVRRLHDAIELIDADRGAVLWLDEYGPGLVHVHCVLDLASDRPRRAFAPGPLRSAWEAGIPGLVDEPGSGDARPGSEARSMCVVALGSDGIREWFLALDSRTPRPPLCDGTSETLMFLAGECASVVLHQDLCAEGPARADDGSFERIRRERFSGWPVLQDAERAERDEATSRRIASRFLVTRLLRSLTDEDFAPDPEALEYQLEGVRRELAAAPAHDPERRAWQRVLEAVDADEHRELAGAVLEFGNVVEEQGHLLGARELHRIAYDIAVAAGEAGLAADAARFLGRVCRRVGEWPDAVHWYDSARTVAGAVGQRRTEALALDGLGNVARQKGNFPVARERYEEVLRIGRDLADGYVQGSAHQNLMIVAKHDERTDEAIRHGWSAVTVYDREQEKLRALADLADVFVRSGQLDPADDALAIVARRMETFEYRVLALDERAYVAALRGDGEAFERRIARLDREPWREAGVAAVAGMLLYRGKSYVALGEREAAERWLGEALEYAERHEINRVLFEAEELLEGLDEETPRLGRELPAPLRATVDEIREPLAEMRRRPAGAAL